MGNVRLACFSSPCTHQYLSELYMSSDQKKAPQPPKAPNVPKEPKTPDAPKPSDAPKQTDAPKQSGAPMPSTGQPPKPQGMPAPDEDRLKKDERLSPKDIDFQPPLVICLSIISRLMGRPVSSATLKAGLPQQEGVVTAASIVRAAERIGITAKTVYREELRSITKDRKSVV